MGVRLSIIIRHLLSSPRNDKLSAREAARERLYPRDTLLAHFDFLSRVLVCPWPCMWTSTPSSTRTTPTPSSSLAPRCTSTASPPLRHAQNPKRQAQRPPPLSGLLIGSLLLFARKCLLLKTTRHGGRLCVPSATSHLQSVATKFSLCLCAFVVIFCRTLNKRNNYAYSPHLEILPRWRL